MVPATSSVDLGLVVPMPTFPEEFMVKRTELLVRILNAAVSFVPIKFVPLFVPVLPVICQSV